MVYLSETPEKAAAFRLEDAMLSARTGSMDEEPGLWVFFWGSESAQNIRELQIPERF